MLHGGQLDSSPHLALSTACCSSSRSWPGATNHQPPDGLVSATEVERSTLDKSHLHPSLQAQMTDILDSTQKSAHTHKSAGGAESRLHPGMLVLAGDDFRVSHTPERNERSGTADDPWITFRQPGIIVASVILSEDHRPWSSDHFTVFANSIGWVFDGLLRPTGDKC